MERSCGVLGLSDAPVLCEKTLAIVRPPIIMEHIRRIIASLVAIIGEVAGDERARRERLLINGKGNERGLINPAALRHLNDQ